jgi:ABC-type dipeptide/oligopeptide/nickel transport system permease subunit
VIIVESIFNYPGIATLMIDAVTTRDMPLVQACSMIFCAGYLLLVLAADVLAIVSNPRLKTDESPPRFRQRSGPPRTGPATAPARRAPPFDHGLDRHGHRRLLDPHGHHRSQHLHDATAIVDTDVFSGMSHKFLLGSDYLGRDMLSRILFGTRATIGLALAATVVASPPVPPWPCSRPSPAAGATPSSAAPWMP